MNREIKFRAYCDIGDENKMLFFSEGKYDNGLLFEHTANHIDDYLSPLMEFTGLKDKNGKEIYEGDFLKISDGFAFVTNIKHEDVKYEVRHEGCDFVLFRGDINMIWGRLSRLQEMLWSCQVVGNIYEDKA